MPPKWYYDCIRTGYDAKTGVLSLSHFSKSRDNEITISGEIMSCHSFVIMPSVFISAVFCVFFLTSFRQGGK